MLPHSEDTCLAASEGMAFSASDSAWGTCHVVPGKQGERKGGQEGTAEHTESPG